MGPLPFPRRGLYVITRDGEPHAALTASVTSALQGGAAVVQLREKLPSERARKAALLRSICREFNVPLIINDDAELAASIGADGVHLGREDVSIMEARALLGARSIIGISCYDSLARAEHAATQGADYVAFGRFFSSVTKPLASPARLDTLLAARSRLAIPIVAIGGITKRNGGELIEAGADLLAVVDAVFGENDPETAARGLLSLFAL
ncbi:thiamine phosphate synthase [Methylotetracoccus oryzae]|uniref:thiamine phosphate synthase n=1 Tax=Methylotetracoccus oryzae TaxID=1919059 RepID=UPI00111AFFB1|nr:thiamine phosphate synthase [Methylotetracoccus oryzae]